MQAGTKLCDVVYLASVWYPDTSELYKGVAFVLVDKQLGALLEREFHVLARINIAMENTDG